MTAPARLHMMPYGADCLPRSPTPCRRKCFVQPHPLHKSYTSHRAAPRGWPAMPRNANGLSPLARDQRASGKGQDDNDLGNLINGGGFITPTAGDDTTMCVTT